MDRVSMVRAAALVGLALAAPAAVFAQVDGRPIHPWAMPPLPPPIIYGVPGPFYAPGYAGAPVFVVPGRPMPGASEPVRHPGVDVVRPDVVMGWGGLPPARFGTTDSSPRIIGGMRR